VRLEEDHAIACADAEAAQAELQARVVELEGHAVRLEEDHAVACADAEAAQAELQARVLELEDHAVRLEEGMQQLTAKAAELEKARAEVRA
jgi:exonuclease VII small subunit